MKPQNFKLSRRFLAFVALLLLFVGLGTIAWAAPSFIPATNSPANEFTGGFAQHKGRVTQAGYGRIVLEDPGVLTRQQLPEGAKAFEVFLVNENTQITDARGNPVELESLEPLSWALVEVDYYDDRNDEPYPAATRICAIDLQTHLDAMEPPQSLE
ncbi:hypothetical protein HGI81_02150 [Olsenella sp. KGMB02461]|nr:hypothetical protein [Olsenella sp. KGMB02461]